MLAFFPADCWPLSRRNGGRFRPEYAGDRVGSGITGFSTSLHAKDSASDQMWLAYWDTSSRLRVAVSTTEGAGRGCSENDDFYCFTMVTVGEPPDWYSEDSYGYSRLSLTVDSEGYLFLAYSDGYDLKIARPATTYGLSVGNCGEIIHGEGYKFYCKTIDSQLDNEGYLGHHASVSISPSGEPMIAYTEDYSYEPFEHYLKVTYQEPPFPWIIFLPAINGFGVDKN